MNYEHEIDYRYQFTLKKKTKCIVAIIKKTIKFKISKKLLQILIFKSDWHI